MAMGHGMPRLEHMTHQRSCAANWRKRALEQDWTSARTAEEIVRCCEVSPLRAHRLARGWTLENAVSQLRALCTELNIDAPKVDINEWGKWETRANTIPRRKTIEILCRLYSTNAGQLGLAIEYPAPWEAAAVTQPRGAGQTVIGEERQAASEWDLPSPPGLTPMGALLDSTRRIVDRTLASGSVTQTQLDTVNERLTWLREQYAATPPP